ncbi:Peroxisomal N1-acetyl-spermine/spermidine oxidase, partial [Caligus rogercresseyi]
IQDISFVNNAMHASTDSISGLEESYVTDSIRKQVLRSTAPGHASTNDHHFDT